eukprot:scaffold8955_cov80-Skeletonema_dohrnii-CCMP3373.AAC.5
MADGGRAVQKSPPSPPLLRCSCCSSCCCHNKQPHKNHARCPRQRSPKSLSSGRAAAHKRAFKPIILHYPIPRSLPSLCFVITVTLPYIQLCLQRVDEFLLSPRKMLMHSKMPRIKMSY